MKKIKEINEFAKLFKLNIPIEEHFEYYIETLSHSYEFKDIVSLVNSYSDFEEWLKENGFNNVGHYKMNFAYHLLLNHLKDSQAYQKCLEFDYSQVKYYEKDHLKMYEGNFMLSLDFSSANFQSMKIFDSDNELKSSWMELCEYFKIHKMLASSKSFRQIIFGNLNPKRFQKIQHMHMLKLVDELSEVIDPSLIIFISHDEVVINLGNEEGVAFEMMQKMIECVEIIRSRRFSKLETWMEIKPTVFNMKKISKGIYVKSIFSSTGSYFVEMYKTLFGCPGNMYYTNFKQNILFDEIEEKDCLFMIENRMAKWVI